MRSERVIRSSVDLPSAQSQKSGKPYDIRYGFVMTYQAVIIKRYNPPGTSSSEMLEIICCRYAFLMSFEG